MKRIACLTAFFLSSLFATGQDFAWAKQMGSSDSQVGEAVITDHNGNVYTTGWFRGTVDFDPGPGIYNLACNPAFGTDPTPNDMFISKLDSLGNFVWAKKISGPGIQTGLAMAFDSAENLYITGHFSNVVDFDPGPGTYNLTSAYIAGLGDYAWNMFVLKLDNTGNFVWAFDVGGPGTGGQSGEKIVVDADDNIYVSGRFAATADFDPGPGTANLIWAGIWDVFVAKYTSAGSYVWAKQLGGTGHELSNSLALDSEENVVVSGYFYGTGDYDPGPGEYILTADGTADFELFLSKLDNDGNFVWVNHLIGDNDAASEVVLTSGTDVLLFSNFSGTVDVDAGVGTMNLVSAGLDDAMIAKYDATGALVWAKSFGGTGDDVVKDATTDALGNIFVTGYFSNTADFDPGPGFFYLTASATDMFLAKYNAEGVFIWAYNIGASGNDYGNGLFVDEENSIYYTGYFDYEVDFDPGPEMTLLNSAYDDIFVLKLTQNYCSNLALVVDSINGVSCDPTSSTLQGYASGGAVPYDYVWSTTPETHDSIAITYTGGYYDFQVTDALGCIAKRTFFVDGFTTLGYDLKTNLIIENIVYSSDTHIWLDAYNAGCAETSGYVEIVLDTMLTLVSVSPTPDLLIGDTLRWNFTDIAYPDEHITAELIVQANDITTINKTAITKSKITPIEGDDFISNNDRIYLNTIGSPFDPNEKSVYPQGICEAGYILTSDTLTYTIRFQNTGTSEAVNVYILDTLSNSLDINTLHIAGNSHSVITELLPGNVIKFIFNDIHLPDSTTDEAASHGYIIFDINAFPETVPLTQIENSSAIIFDFNEPIITNTVTNTILDVLPILNTEQHFSICEGDDVHVGLNSYSAVGTYLDTLNSTLGCDSIVTTVIDAVFPISSLYQSFSICSGEFVAVGDSVYYDSGSYVNIVSNINGCDSTIYTSLVVNPIDSSEIAIELCSGDSFDFNGTTITESGNYVANLSGIDGCDSVITLTVALHTLDIGVTVSDTSLLANQDAATYQWVDCLVGFAPISGENNQVFHPGADGEYAVIVNDGMCTDTSDCFTFVIEDVITGDLANQYQLFPNPGNGIFTIELNNSGTMFQLEIFSIAGVLIWKQNTSEQSVIADISEYPSGVYFLKINSQNNLATISISKL